MSETKALAALFVSVFCAYAIHSEFELENGITLGAIMVPIFALLMCAMCLETLVNRQPPEK